MNKTSVALGQTRELKSFLSNDVLFLIFGFMLARLIYYTTLFQGAGRFEPLFILRREMIGQMVMRF